jgi:hypothetical protein
MTFFGTLKSETSTCHSFSTNRSLYSVDFLTTLIIREEKADGNINMVLCMCAMHFKR